MRDLVRLTTRVAVAGWLGLAACMGCSKHPPEPDKPEAAPEGATAVASSAQAPAAAVDRHPRDDAGRLIPRTAPPPLDPSAIPVKAGRDPDWDLDSDDAARDYVRRYVTATKRYGETMDCVSLGASEASGDRRRVEVKTATGCPGAGTQRDVFLVDVGSDRLSLDDRAKRDPLARWPDGSDPEAPANPVRDDSQLRQWQGALKDVIRKQLLVPVRVQGYGRGSYLVVTVAGWHATVTPAAAPDSLRSFADALCKANHDLPLAFFAGVDRSKLLRMRCPGGARWDTL
jgi:hypothetical protein